MVFFGILLLLLPFILLILAPTILLRNDLRKGTSELLIVALASVAFFVAATIYAGPFMVGHDRHATSTVRFRRRLHRVYFLGEEQKTFFERHGRYASLSELYGDPGAEWLLKGVSFYLNEERDHWCLYAAVDIRPYEFCVIFNDDRDRLGLIFAPELKDRETVPLGTAYAGGPFSQELRVELKEPQRLYRLREHQLYWYRLVPGAILLSVIVLARLVLRLLKVRWRVLLVVDWAVCFVIWGLFLVRSLLLFG